MLGVTGGAASYKAVQTARDLSLLGADVDVVLTRAAREFVQPLAFQAVTGRRPLSNLFSAEGAALHIRLARSADAVVVAPATADFIARTRAGRGNDLLGSVLLATKARVVIAPAMNEAMFGHPATRANLRCLRERGVRVAGPTSGRLGAGEGRGMGRMIDGQALIEEVGRALSPASPLAGARVLVTSGSTREALDPVRYLGNRSSGLMGSELARSAWLRGADVTLLSGPSSLKAPHGPKLLRVESAAEMLDAALDAAPALDAAIFAAAVSDFRPAVARVEKIKRSQEGPRMRVDLTANPDVALQAGTKMKRGAVRVGFALETSRLLQRARRKLEEKGFDFVVANPAGEEGSGFEAPANRATLIFREGAPRELGLLPKREVAEAIIDEIESRLENAAE